MANIGADVQPASGREVDRPTERRRVGATSRAVGIFGQYGMVFALIGVVIAAEIVYHPFLSITNLQNLAIQNAPTAIAAVGMTFVIVVGGFDLSVGGILGIGSVLFAKLAVGGMPILLALALVLLAGIACGLVNGLVITRLKVNSFVATLGTGALFTGIADLYSNAAPVQAFVPGFSTLGSSRPGGVALPVIILVVLYVGAALVLGRTVYGRSVYATGGNREATRLAGISVDRVQLVAFLISGLLACLGGALLASTLSTGEFNQGAGLPLDAIAAVVIGGTSLYGGEGAIWRTVVGVLFLATLSNLFSSLSVNEAIREMVTGGVVVLAVAFTEIVRRTRR